MNYTLLINEQAGQPHTLTLSGHLTIKTSFALHAELLEYAKQQEGMRLEVKDVEEFDAVFLQLLLAMGRYHDQHQKPFHLFLNLNPMHHNLVQVAGITKNLNTNPS